MKWREEGERVMVISVVDKNKFNEFGDCEGALLRPGNVHSAERWREVLEPIVERHKKRGVRLLFRGDAAFAKPEVYDYLEPRDIGYAIRLPANEVTSEKQFSATN